MTVIYKQVLQVGRQIVELPVGSGIIHVAEQNGQPCMWYGFDEKEAGREKVDIQVVGTEYVFVARQYLGSCHCGPFVWHILADLQENTSIILPAFITPDH